MPDRDFGTEQLAKFYKRRIRQARFGCNVIIATFAPFLKPDFVIAQLHHHWGLVGLVQLSSISDRSDAKRSHCNWADNSWGQTSAALSKDSLAQLRVAPFVIPATEWNLCFSRDVLSRISRLTDFELRMTADARNHSKTNLD